MNNGCILFLSLIWISIASPPTSVDVIIRAGKRLSWECPVQNWLEYSRDGRDWTRLDNQSIAEIKEMTDVDDTGHYRCVEMTSTVVTKLLNLTVYNVEIAWFYSCPTDGTAGCYLVHSEEKLSVLENSTIDLGCIVTYVNIPGETVNLEVQNQGLNRVPECQTNYSTDRDPPLRTYGTLSCVWKVRVNKNDAERKIFCSTNDKDQAKSSVNFMIQVRDAKFPHSPLMKQNIIVVWARDNQNLLAFVAVTCPTAFILTFLFCYRRRFKENNKRKATRPGRSRKSSILMARSSHDKRTVSKHRFGGLGAGTAVEVGSLIDDEDDFNEVPTLPKRPPPRSIV